MICTQCQELLSDYIDGALELGEQVKVESHLADCEPCRAMRDDLLQIVHFSHKLPLRAPSASLWPRIREDIDELRPGFWSRPVRWWVSVKTINFNLSVPQMMAATAALVIVLSTAIIMSRRDNRPIDSLAAVALGTPAEITRLSNNDLQQLE